MVSDREMLVISRKRLIWASEKCAAIERVVQAYVKVRVVACQAVLSKPSELSLPSVITDLHGQMHLDLLLDDQAPLLKGWV